MTPVEAARAAGPYGSLAYHNAYNKLWYAARRKDKVFAQKERAYNRNRDRSAQQKAYAAQPDIKAKLKLKEKVRSLLRYGVTLEQYNAMIKAQGGKCAICDTEQELLKRSLEVDHSHKTLAVRGLLCRRCNLALGIVDDSIDVLRSAILYLERWA